MYLFMYMPSIYLFIRLFIYLVIYFIYSLFSSPSKGDDGEPAGGEKEKEGRRQLHDVIRGCESGRGSSSTYHSHLQGKTGESII